jgi:glutamate 5-kinase
LAIATTFNADFSWKLWSDLGLLTSAVSTLFRLWKTNQSQYRKYNQCLSREQLYSIINENDTVATDERFGDNDKLAA